MNTPSHPSAGVSGRLSAPYRAQAHGHGGSAPRHPADLSPRHVRWVLQALLLGVAFMLLMGFYTVVRGAAARGPAVLAAAPPSATGVGSQDGRDCGSAPQGACVQAPENTLSSATPPLRLVSFERR